MKKSTAIIIITTIFCFCSVVAFADNWNNLTNPTDVPPQEIVNDMAKVAIGVTVVGAAVLVGGRRGSEITADFSVEDATKEKPGSITIRFSGGEGPYTVTGINPKDDQKITSSGNTSTITNVKPGEYTITFRDAKGDTFSAKTKVGGTKEKTQVDSGGDKDDIG